MTKAVDVFAKYQGAINWRAVAAAGVGDVFVKVTNGSEPASPAGDSYVTGAHGQGIAVGGYHYALGGSAANQAVAFVAELRRLSALDLAPALDFEDPSLPTDLADRRAWIVQFFGVVKANLPGLDRALLYSSGSELTAIHADTISLPGLDILIWDAEYGPNDGSEHPVTHYTGRIAIHQYTSVGHVPGIGTAVDVDTITADITAEDDMALTDEFTYTSRQDGKPRTKKVSEALAAAADLAECYLPGFTGAGPAGRDAVMLAQMSSTLGDMATVVKQLAADVVALKAGQAAPLAGTYPATITIAAPSTPGFAHDDVEGV
jgi:GH25 family lysozyme M1 (1,4-beta-N-acetylmuramidase)